MRSFLAASLLFLLAIGTGYAQEAAVSTGLRPILTQPVTTTALGLEENALRTDDRFPRSEGHSLSTAPEWEGLKNKDEEDQRLTRIIVGSTFLGVGTAGIGIGTYIGVKTILIIRGSDDSAWAALDQALGGVLLFGSASLIGGGIWCIIQGIRLLQGKDLAIPSSHPSSVHLSSSPPSVRISL